MNSTNFRPISLLSSFSTIFEMVMKKKLIKFLDSKKFFSDNQYGFRECLNAESALINSMSKVHNGFNLGKSVTGIFLDIKKALDTVDHNILYQNCINAE